MKIAILSDIHFDINYSEQDSLEEALIRKLKEDQPEYFIIAGDLSNDYKKSLYHLDKIQNESGVKLLFVPGNHDLWNIENDDKSTSYIYEKLREFGGNLCGNPVQLNERWTVVGDILWYDYSFADSKFSFEDLSTGKYAERNWKDKEYISWEMDDVRVTEGFRKKIDDQLLKNKGKNIILVSHMLSHNEFTVKNQDLWKYFNGYLGSSRYTELIRNHDSVRYSIMGHVHYRKEYVDHGVRYLCNCLNYRKEWTYEKAADELELAMKYIEI
ncbi:MAG TPA: metallophosphoesterase [Thermotogota bacterium]|nr:metallophosphoesterase [Thermotogota bacterium]HPJ89809.1 metallophosphoesterase [Thermotogota bacterium]HPR96978.1 metallophosphoesterase [Thermotogota bacterium]